MRIQKQKRTNNGILLPLVLLFSQAASVQSSVCDYYYDDSLSLTYTYLNTFTTDCVGRFLDKLPGNLNPNTKHLYLSSNNITKIDNFAFETLNVTGLLTLNLSDNKINSIEKSAFKGLPELKILQLNNNYITSLSPDVFEDCTKLWYLGLRGNPINFPNNGSFLNIQSLKTLDLSDCDLDVVSPSLLADGSKLQIFKLSRNNLQSLDIDAFKNLRRLELDSNSIRSLSPEVFRFNEQLVYLTLSNNALKIGKGKPIFRSESVRYLYLNKCGISQISAITFVNITNMEELHMDENLLTAIHKSAFSSLKNLRILSLRHNTITSLELNTFESNTGLNKLDLTGNPLSWVDIQFFDIPSLTHLDLSSCSISSPNNELFSGTPNLTWLNLKSNQLETINFNVLTPLKSLKYLDILDNPLTCNKTLHSVWKWCKQNDVNCSAHCSSPQGDWSMLRYLEFNETLQIRAIPQVSSEDDSLTTLAMRFIIPFGAMAILIAVVFLVRWIIHIAVLKRYYYSYEVEEEPDYRYVPGMAESIESIGDSDIRTPEMIRTSEMKSAKYGIQGRAGYSQPQG